MNRLRLENAANYDVASRELDHGRHYNARSREIIGGYVADILQQEAAIKRGFRQIFAVTGSHIAGNGHETPEISLGLMADGVRKLSATLTDKWGAGEFSAAFTTMEPRNLASLFIEVECYQTETGALALGDGQEAYFGQLERTYRQERSTVATPTALFLKHLEIDGTRLERATETHWLLTEALQDPALNPAFADSAIATFGVARP